MSSDSLVGLDNVRISTMWYKSFNIKNTILLQTDLNLYSKMP